MENVLSNDPRRWVVVADSPFIPSEGGGEREHLGFVRAAVDAGLVAALVVPTDEDPSVVGRADDLDAIRELVAPAPVFVIPRVRSLKQGLSTRLPYVVASRPVPHGLVDAVAAAVPDADAVVVFAYKSHEIGRVLAEGLGVPAVLRQHNLEGVYHRALAAAAPFPRSLAVRLEAERIDRDERRLERSQWLTGIADISASDAELRRRRSTVPVAYVPPFALGSLPTTAEATWRPSSSQTVVFLGALDVSTNHDAIEWFARSVWPTVRRSVPAARWSIVGRRPTQSIRDLVASVPGAELHADVPDPGVHLRSAALAINPAVSGSGVNIKLVEYLATGVPVVSSTKGTAGLVLDRGRDLLVADEAGDFAEAVTTLLTDAEAAATLARHGRRTALELMDVSASLRTMSALLTQNAGADDQEPEIDDFEVVLVSYKSRHHVEALLDGWPEKLPVVVVDNSGNSDGIADLARLPNVRYLSGGGQGFGRAANLGAFSSEKPYAVFVNPDSRPTVEHLLALVRGLARDGAAVSHAATVTGRDGNVEIGVGGWEPSVRRLAVNATGLHKALPRTGLFAKPALGEHIELDWTTGACMAVRTEPFRELGGFDETFFVYAEDMAFGRQAREAGWRCVLRDDVVVPHGAGSSGAPSTEMLRLRGASFAGYLRRYHPGARGTAMRALFALGAAVRMAAQFATGRRAEAEQSRALLAGTLTQRAYVGGEEVARARFDETNR